MPIAVGCPVGSNLIRVPDVAVGRIDTPDAIRIQVLVTDHVARDIARRHRAVQGTVTLTGPAVELIGTRRGKKLVVAQVIAAEPITLLRIDEIAGTRPRYFGLPAAHDDIGQIALRVHRDAVVTPLAQRERELWRDDLEHLIGCQTPHTQVQTALCQLQLRAGVVKIEN